MTSSGMTRFRKLLQRIKERDEAFAEMKRPFKKYLWPFSAAATAYEFVKDFGVLTPALAGLIVLTLVLLYIAISVPTIKLFTRRALAFIIDLFFLGIVLFISLSYYQLSTYSTEDILQIRYGYVLMGALWLVFCYFAVLDWRFGGTVGKRFLGLSVTALDERKLDLRLSLERNFLSLPLPIIGGFLLNAWIQGGPNSAARLFLGEAANNLLVAFVPFSILFFGGNQSIADRLTHTAIKVEHETTSVPTKIASMTWMGLISSSIVWAFLLATLTYIGIWRPAVSVSHQLPAPKMQVMWPKSDPQSVATLWKFLPLGLKDPTFGIREIEIWSASPNTFTFKQEDSYFLMPLSPDPYLRSLKREMPVIVVSMNKDLVSVKVLILQNYLRFIGENTPLDKRPAFGVLQLATTKEFGLFSITQSENTLMCFMRADNTPVNFYADISPHGAVRFSVSVAQIGALLVGAGIPFQ